MSVSNMPWSKNCTGCSSTNGLLLKQTPVLSKASVRMCTVNPRIRVHTLLVVQTNLKAAASWKFAPNHSALMGPETNLPGRHPSCCPTLRVNIGKVAPPYTLGMRLTHIQASLFRWVRNGMTREYFMCLMHHIRYLTIDGQHAVSRVWMTTHSPVKSNL